MALKINMEDSIVVWKKVKIILDWKHEMLRDIGRFYNKRVM